MAMVVLAILMVGLTNLFLGGKRWIAHRRFQVTGGELGKVFLDDLQLDVTVRERTNVAQSGWGQTGNCLTNPSAASCPGNQTISNTSYAPTYTSDNVIIGNCVATNTCARRVRLDVRWTEPVN